MRSIKMTAKKGGTCTTCHGAILPGQSIFWQRGAGAHHVNCEHAANVASMCTACSGSGRRWNNANCTACDGTGSRKVQDFARAGGHPAPCPQCNGKGHDNQDMPCGACDATGRKANRDAKIAEYERDVMGVDMAYEDDCARRCGL